LQKEANAPELFNAKSETKQEKELAITIDERLELQDQ